jgi:VanZ family protein
MENETRPMARLLSFVKSNWIGFTLVTLAAITILSLWPLSSLPSLPGTDKTHHFMAYAALMFPTALRKPRGWILLGFLFIAYSGAIELVQPYVNRYGEWLDLAANTAGLFCGLVAAEVVNRFFADDSKHNRR